MWISTGAIVAFLAAVCFSTKAIFVKLTYLYGADAISSLALRMIMALPFLLVAGWYSTRDGARPLTRADWKNVLILGFMGYYLSSLLDFMRSEVFAPDLELTVETDLIASGFDSMSLVRVLLFIETTYGFWIPQSEINADALQNIRALAATVARLLHER